MNCVPYCPLKSRLWLYKSHGAQPIAELDSLVCAIWTNMAYVVLLIPPLVNGPIEATITIKVFKPSSGANALAGVILIIVCGVEVHRRIHARFSGCRTCWSRHWQTSSISNDFRPCTRLAVVGLNIKEKYDAVRKLNLLRPICMQEITTWKTSRNRSGWIISGWLLIVYTSWNAQRVNTIS